MDNSTGGSVDGMYHGLYSADELQRMAQANQQAMMQNMMGDAMGESNGLGNQAMDGFAISNQKDPQRRWSLQQPPSTTPNIQTNDMWRRSMMDFGNLQVTDLDGFQFDPPKLNYTPITSHSPTKLENGGGIANRRMASRRSSHRRESTGDMAVDSRFQLGQFSPLVQSPIFQQAMDTPMDMGSSASYVPPNMNIAMDYAARMDTSPATDLPGMGVLPTSDFGLPQGGPLTQQSEQAPLVVQSNPTTLMTTSSVPDLPIEKRPLVMNDTVMEGGLSQSVILPNVSNPPTMQRNMSQPNLRQGMNMQSGLMNLPTSTQPNVNPQQQNFTTSSIAPRNINSFSTAGPIETIVGQPRIPQYLNAYSQSGFDMLAVLMRVAARPKPQINIGAVDMSCAFVVCDVTKHDVPIVYCSEMFERLTGYIKHEILGRNCRFLQGPDGKVESGHKRKYCDDQAVLHLKNMIAQRQEAQISLINYRKGGQPFMNLLTMIPITWDSDEIRFYVGFQVDLVEQPTSITNKNPDGSYSINYQRGLLPRYVFQNTPETNSNKNAMDTTKPIERDDVSMVLQTLGAGGDTEFSKRGWDKVLLENTDDVLHVLSLKGLFLYLSRASKKVLEYDPQELVGTALSSVCHPSDIVPVTRELKDTAPGSTVDIVFRIRRKHSGYTWFESHGSLHTEQGKGKKCIILVGRERPVYALERRNLVSATEIGENELWSKMSTSGMYLFVSSHARSLLDRQPDELRGTSAQNLMRPDSKQEFNKMLELARSGVKATFKHDIQNKRGQTLHAQTTLYPGDAVEGQKPTFLVAQTKLLKMSRAPPPLLKHHSEDSQVSHGAVSTESGASKQLSGNGTPYSITRSSSTQNQHLVTSAGGHALPIGNQDQTLASDDNVFDELKTTRSTSWQFELRQMEKRNRVLAEEVQSLNSSKKKRKRRKGMGQLQKDCANCHTRSTPEWRRGPSGNRDLCNSCGLRWAKANGRVSPRTNSHSDKNSNSPLSMSPADTKYQGGKDLLKSPKKTNLDSHNFKTARMEAMSSPGFAGGIPAKIEEVAEPPE